MDPNTVYSESQYGVLVRYDKPTGQELVLQPQEGKGEPPLRWNWDSPVIICPHSHTRLYFAANRLFRSDDRGRHVEGDQRRPDAANRPQYDAGDGKGVGSGCGGEERVDVVLWKYRGARRSRRRKKG